MPHIHEKIDFTVAVLIVHNHKVLLRVHDKYKLWLGVGGHVELDENPNEAALREVKEEVGLTVKLIAPHELPKSTQPGYQELIPPFFTNIHVIGESHQHIDLQFFATSESDLIVENENEKSFGYKWFTREELDDPQYGIRPALIFYAKAALDVISPQ